MFGKHHKSCDPSLCNCLHPTFQSQHLAATCCCTHPNPAFRTTHQLS